MCTELYISYAFYDKDQIEAMHFSINVLAFFSELYQKRLKHQLLNESFVVFNRGFSILMMNGSHVFLTDGLVFYDKWKLRIFQ